MKITWITRSFLDYRIPLFQSLNQLCSENLTLIYNDNVVPQRCKNKIKIVLGERAIGLKGEKRLIGKEIQPLSNLSKNNLRVPFQPNLIDVIINSQPDIIISDGFFQWTYAPLWLNFIKKIPHIMCYEGTLHTERNVGFFRLLYRKIVSRYINIIHVNGILSFRFLNEKLNIPKRKIRFGNMTSEISVISKKSLNFPENQKINLKNQLNLNDSVFLFVGRLVPIKGLIHLIENWLNLSFDNASLLIIGDGEERENLEKFCFNKKINNIHFQREIDHDEVYKFYAISDIFIIPTLQDNWSLVVPEAMSAGLPILSSKYNGCWPELVQPDNGWVFDPLNKNNFKETLEKALKNKENWKKMGEVSRNIVENFSPEKIAAKIYDSCKKITRSN